MFVAIISHFVGEEKENQSCVNWSQPKGKMIHEYLYIYVRQKKKITWKNIVAVVEID